MSDLDSLINLCHDLLLQDAANDIIDELCACAGMVDRDQPVTIGE